MGLYFSLVPKFGIRLLTNQSGPVRSVYSDMGQSLDIIAGMMISDIVVEIIIFRL